MDEVLIDTSAWIDFFTRSDSKAAEVVDRLLKEETVAVTGVVIAELLRGTRTPHERELLLAKFQSLTYLDVTREDWITAGSIAAGLGQRGVNLPLSDVIIAAVAQANDCAIYTTDAHFSRIPNIRLFR